MTSTLWFGPVNAAQTGGAAFPGTTPEHRVCTGDGHPSCGELAATTPIQGPAYAAAFSAGGHYWKRVLLASQANRDAVQGLLLSDATYTTERDASGRAKPIEGFVAYALDAHASGRPMIATASAWPNKTHPTGAETVWALVDELGARGLVFVDALELFPGAKRAVRSRSLAVADYGLEVTHAGHATKLARTVLESALPALLSSSSSTGDSSGDTSPAADSDTSRGGWIAALVMVLGAGAAAWWRRRQRR